MMPNTVFGSGPRTRIHEGWLAGLQQLELVLGKIGGLGDVLRERAGFNPEDGAVHRYWSEEDAREAAEEDLHLASDTAQPEAKQPESVDVGEEEETKTSKLPF